MNFQLGYYSLPIILRNFVIKTILEKENKVFLKKNSILPYKISCFRPVIF